MGVEVMSRVVSTKALKLCSYNSVQLSLVPPPPCSLYIYTEFICLCRIVNMCKVEYILICDSIREVICNIIYHYKYIASAQMYGL